MGVIKIKNLTELTDIFIKSETDAMIIVSSDNLNNYYATLVGICKPEYNTSVKGSIYYHSIKLIDTDTDANLLFRGAYISFGEYDKYFKMTPKIHHGSIRCENIYIPYSVTTIIDLFEGFNDIGIFINTNRDNIKIFNYEYSSVLAEYSYKIEEENKRHDEKVKYIRNTIERRAQKILQAKAKLEKDTTTNNILSVESLSLMLIYIKNIFRYIDDDIFDEDFIELTLKQFYELVKGMTYAEIHEKYNIKPTYLSKLNREIFAKRGMPLGTRVYKNK